VVHIVHGLPAQGVVLKQTRILDAWRRVINFASTDKDDVSIACPGLPTTEMLDIHKPHIHVGQNRFLTRLIDKMNRMARIGVPYVGLGAPMLLSVHHRVPDHDDAASLVAGRGRHHRHMNSFES
jgi:hypothetical protein